MSVIQSAYEMESHTNDPAAMALQDQAKSSDAMTPAPGHVTVVS